MKKFLLLPFFFFSCMQNPDTRYVVYMQDESHTVFYSYYTDTFDVDKSGRITFVGTTNQGKKVCFYGYSGRFEIEKMK